MLRVLTFICGGCLRLARTRNESVRARAEPKSVSVAMRDVSCHIQILDVGIQVESSESPFSIIVSKK